MYRIQVKSGVSKALVKHYANIVDSWIGKGNIIGRPSRAL